jgi:hypothetical protein
VLSAAALRLEEEVAAPAKQYHTGLLLLLPCHADSTVGPCSILSSVAIVPIELVRFLPLR